MNKVKLATIAALVGISSLAMAEDANSDAARQQRMDSALQDYETNHGTASTPSSSPGKLASAEDSMKSGMHRAGSAIERGAKKVGHAVSTGVHKVGDAISRTGEKMKSKTTDQ